LIVFTASFAEIFIPGRSAEITDAILALATGEFIRALEVGASQEVRRGGVFGRGAAAPNTLSRRLILAEPAE
jgi:hypothetical protein